MNKPVSKEEQLYENHFSANFKRDESVRFIKLPFKEGYLDPGNSFNETLSKHYLLGTRFMEAPKLHNDYSKLMTEYIELGHMEAINTADPLKENRFYLSHHPVKKKKQVLAPRCIWFSTGLQIHPMGLI